jgi:hypothetical protein
VGKSVCGALNLADKEAMSRQKSFSQQELAQVLAAIEAELDNQRTKPHITAEKPTDTKKLKLLCREPLTKNVGWPKRSTSCFRSLKLAVDQVVGRQLSFEELSDATGEAKSTLSNWLGGVGSPSFECVLRLLERLPDAARNQLLSSPPVSRCYPTLGHPRLAYDLAAISRFTTILHQATGTTLIHGIREDLVTFLVTALGHNYYHAQLRNDAVRGFDVHAPDWFVPLPTVSYLSNTQSCDAIRQRFLSEWPTLRKHKGGMVILNGIWPQVADLYDEIFELAGQNHVIIGTTTMLTRNHMGVKMPGPAHVVTVSADRLTTSNRILTEFQVV